MESRLNGCVTYLALQRLTEKAWDEGDMERLHMLSAAVDRCMLENLAQEQETSKAI